MATSRFFLDNRRIADNLPAPLKITIRNNNTTAFISTGLSLRQNEWNPKEQKVTNLHPSFKALNTRLAIMKGEVDMQLIELSDKGGIRKLTATEIKNQIQAKLHPENFEEDKISFLECFQKFIDTKKGSTKGIYELTFSKVKKFSQSETLSYEDISLDWLLRFENWMQKTSPSKNARNIHLRNIRAVFNYAIDNEYTAHYPFRRYKIRAEETRKRSLSIEELRKLFTCEVESYAQIYRDMFKLIFMLIGINTVDLHRLTKITKQERIEYKRAKTGRLYSIRVEPEAMEIINKYKGEKGLLCIADRWSDHRNFRHQANTALQTIGVERNKGGRLKGGEPKKNSQTKPKGIWPELTTYWARHSWATIAAELDIPDATISLALGHAGENATTDIYIRRNQKKVDEANRRVLDWVLYGKR